MKKISITIVTIAILICTQCQKKENPFAITTTNVGPLLKTSYVKDIDSIFKNDSIVRLFLKANVSYTSNERISIYEKGGNLLMTITPNKDSIAGVENIEVFDQRYTTTEGITLKSTFKDINTKYTVVKVLNSINNLLIFVKEADVYFTIDKKELPEELRYKMGTIDAVQIPDAAKIKYLMVGWEK